MRNKSRARLNRDEAKVTGKDDSLSLWSSAGGPGGGVGGSITFLSILNYLLDLLQLYNFN